MSALLAHVKAFRVLAASFRTEAALRDEDHHDGLLSVLALVHDRAADALEQQARDECTSQPTSTDPMKELCEAAEEALKAREEFMKASGVMANLRAHNAHIEALTRLRTALENAKGGGR